MLIIRGLFVPAGLCKIGGGYLVWGWMREHKPLLWALLGAAILAAYGVVAALQPISEFRRGTPLTAVSLHVGVGLGVVVDGFRPDRWDLLGAAVCIVGVCRRGKHGLSNASEYHSILHSPPGSALDVDPL